MRTQGVVAFAVAALFAVVAPAAAQAPSAGGWSVSFDVGVDGSLSGDIYGRGNGTLSTRPVQLSARTYRKAYGPGVAWSVGVGRSLTDRTELRVRVVGSTASSDRRQTGRVGTGNVTGTLVSELDKQTEVGVDVGYRVYFRSGTSVQPYVGGLLGVARVSAIAVALDVPDAVFQLQENLDLYADSTAFTGGASAGLLFNRSDTFGIYVNVDVRYRSDLKANDGELAGTNFEPINDKSKRVNAPLSVGVRVRF